MNEAAIDFHQRVKAWFIANPSMAYVIHAKPAPEDAGKQLLSANAWFAYLDAKGLPGTAACWRAILTGNGKAITVPAERPELFDYTYVPPIHEPHWKGENPSTRARGDISGVVERTRKALSATKPRGKAPTWEPEPEAIQRPSDWLADAIENPRPVPALSDEAIKRFQSGRAA